jgi:acyl-ACP thioesterase
MLQQPYHIRFDDCDFSGRMRIDRLFAHLGDLAIKDAINTGLYREDMYGRYGWIVSKQTFCFYDELCHDDDIVLITDVCKPSAVIFPRYFTIKKGEKVVAEGFSSWTLVDLTTRRIVRVKSAGITIPEVTETMTPPERLKSLHNPVTDHYQVVYSDLDMNGHMNNTQYLRVAYDLIGKGYLKTHRLTKLSINYEKEVPADAHLDIAMKEEQDHFYFEGFVEESCFLLEMSFEASHD